MAFLTPEQMDILMNLPAPRTVPGTRIIKVATSGASPCFSPMQEAMLTKIAFQGATDQDKVGQKEPSYQPASPVEDRQNDAGRESRPGPGLSPSMTIYIGNRTQLGEHLHRMVLYR